MEKRILALHIPICNSTRQNGNQRSRYRCENVRRVSSTHLARAEAYRQQMMFRPAVVEYRAALQFAPKDVTIHLEVAEAFITCIFTAMRSKP